MSCPQPPVFAGEYGATQIHHGQRRVALSKVGDERGTAGVVDGEQLRPATAAGLPVPDLSQQAEPAKSVDPLDHRHPGKPDPLPQLLAGQRALGAQHREHLTR